MQRGHVLVAMALAAGLVVGCSDGGDEGVAPATTAEPAPEEVVAPRPQPPLELTETGDVRYHENIGDLHAPLLDIYAPVESGPWPVVVMFHGGAGLFQDKADSAPIARHVAEQGAVVFAPSIGGPDPDFESPNPQIMSGMLDEVACAQAFAVEHAAEHGGDPDDLNIYGFSGGAQAAATTIWAPMPIADGCLASAASPTPRVAVLFEGDLFIAPSWDDAIETGALTYDELTVWDDLDATPDTEIILVVGTETVSSPNHRVPLGDVWSDSECGADGEGWVPRGGTCRYLELRDPDGDYRRDMERLGQLDDGFGDVSENTLILADRLEAAGHPATVVTVDGLSHAAGPDVRAQMVGPIIVEHVLG